MPRRTLSWKAREVVRAAGRRLLPGHDDAQSWRIVGWTNHPAKVISSLETVIRKRRFPDLLARVYDRLADAYENLGDIDAADAAHRRSVASAPGWAWGHGNYAAFLLDHADDPAAAAEEARNALAIADYGVARGVLADAYVELGTRLPLALARPQGRGAPAVRARAWGEP